jgi:Pentapeptide repeats (9 copies)
MAVTSGGAEFSGGEVWFAGAEFSGGKVYFSGAKFSSDTVWFGGAEFSGGEVSFYDAEFSGGEVSFGWAKFSGGVVDFTGPGDWSFPPKFPRTGTPPPGVKLPKKEDQSRAWGPVRPRTAEADSTPGAALIAGSR